MSFNFSNITDDLFIGTTPLASDYDGLRELGVRLIINMRLTRSPFPDLHHTPIQLLWLRTIDSPFFPLPISKLMIGARGGARDDPFRWEGLRTLRVRSSPRTGDGVLCVDRAGL